MKMYLLSDNVDTIRGMRLAGVDGALVHTRGETERAFSAACADKEIGVVLVAQKLSAEFPDIFREVKLSGATPLIVDIPDRHGSGSMSGKIAEYVREAIGIKI